MRIIFNQTNGLQPHRHFFWWPTKVAEGEWRWLESTTRRGEKYVYRDCLPGSGVIADIEGTRWHYE